EEHNSTWRKDAPNVCIAHLYYPDLVEDLLDRCLKMVGIDLLITIPEHWPPALLDRVLRRAAKARVFVCSNRGRDLWPFVNALSFAAAQGYELVCKVHTKKSTHLTQGDAWRQSLLQEVLDPRRQGEILASFRRQPSLGVLAPRGSLLSVRDPSTMLHNLAKVEELLGRWNFNGSLDFEFPAGSM